MNNNIYTYYIKYKKILKELNDFKYWNVIIITIWVILYILGLLNVGRIKYFVATCFIIWVYKIICNCIEKQLKKIKIKNKYFYILMKISEKTNIILFLITNLEPLLYNISGYNIKIYLIKIVLSLITPFKLVIWYIYIVINNIKKYTLYELIWKRAYGTILSVLVFTNIIQIILEICGTRLNMIIGLYIIIFILSYEKRTLYNKVIYEEFYNSKNDILNVLYKDIYEIWKIKSEVNLICNYIKKNWNTKTNIEKFTFLCIYGQYLNVNWLKILNIDSYNKWEIQTKLKIINAVTRINIFDLEFEYLYWCDNMRINLFNMFLNINELLKYKSHLLYLQLLYEKFKGVNNIKIYKEHNLKNLLEYNEIILKSYLYYYWDVNNNTKFEIDSDYGLQLFYIVCDKKVKEESFQNYIKYFKGKYFKIEKQDYKNFYEIKLFANLDSSYLGYINDNEKYKKYINFYNWYNSPIKFETKEGKVLILQESLDIMDIMEFSICSEITKEWYSVLENEKEKLIKEYKKGIYIEYLKKV